MKKNQFPESDAVRRLVTLKIGGDDLGIDISIVREPGKIVRISGKRREGGPLEGVIDLDGHGMPVVDMRRSQESGRRGHPEETILVMIDTRYKTLAFLVSSGKNGVQTPVREENRIFSEGDRIFINSSNKQHILNINDILCIRAEGEYSTIFLSSGSKFLVRRLIKQWEKQLPGSIFLRIHRSTIVNINHVERIEKWSKRSHVVYLKNLQETFVISQRYFAKIKSRFLV